MNNEDYINHNRKLWNSITPIHISSNFYDLEKFKKYKNSLQAIELEELSNDVRGKELLHLQCHFGQDTISWENLGAKTTGIDFSEVAIKKAQELAQEINFKSKFKVGNILKPENWLEQKYDIVFTSYGVLTWIPDLKKWGKTIAQALKKDGIFYMVEIHPFLMMYDFQSLEISYNYFFEKEPIEEISKGTYAEPEADFSEKEYSWNHHLGEIINTLIENDLEIEFLHEFNYLPYKCFPNMIALEENKWVLMAFGEKVPYIFSIKARKK